MTNLQSVTTTVEDESKELNCSGDSILTVFDILAKYVWVNAEWKRRWCSTAGNVLMKGGYGKCKAARLRHGRQTMAGYRV